MAAEHLRALGQRIRERREALDLTQEEVARKMPGTVSGARISKWERGENRPHDDSLEELAKALDTTAAALLVPKPDKTTTPDLMAVPDDPLLQRVLAAVEKQNTLLDKQTKILHSIEKRLDQESDVMRALDAATQQAKLMLEAVLSASPAPAATRKGTGASRSPRASS